MKNYLKLFGIIAIVAVIGFSMTSCDNDDDGGNGIPVELVGMWAKSPQASEISFAIRADGSGQITTYEAK